MYSADNLARGIERSKELARVGDSVAALDLASKLVTDYPDDIEAWLLRAYVHELNESFAEAESDLTRAMATNALEPHVFFTRGRMRYQLGRYHEAGGDFQEGLRLCDFHRNDYYRSELYFWRGAVYLELGDKKAALDVLTLLPDDFVSFIERVLSKQDMLDRCV
jgi:tetratricopeptide (TPR) repeat protein